MTVTTYGGRTFDRIERVDPRSFDYLLVTHPDYDAMGVQIFISTEDKVLQSAITALTMRMTAAETNIASLWAAVTVAPVPTPTPIPTPAPPAPPIPQATIWPCGQVLDQGQTGMCVGYAWAGLTMTSPLPKTIVVSTGDDENGTADAIYDRAQVDDHLPPDPQSGASTTGGAQASVQLGFIRSYTWALNVSQIAKGIQGIGPGIGGFPWRSTMMDPDVHGVLDCGDKSKDVGGHEFVLPRYFPAGAPGNPSNIEDMFGMRNSWGPRWGLDGDAFLPADGLVDMLADGGDCTFPSK